MNVRFHRRTRRSALAAGLAGALAVGVAAAAIGAGPAGASTVPAGASGSGADDALQGVLDQAFQTEVDASELHPLIVEALQRATTELTPEQLDTAYECWEGTDCEVPGGGEVVLAIADAFGGNTWRRISKMELILQALTYPEIGRIISSDANFDLPTYQSQVRGAVAQGADLIVGYNDFGDSMAPTFADAQESGAFVTVYVGPVPAAGPEAIVTQIVTDTCTAGESMADVAIELTGGDGQVAFFNGTPGNPQGAEWNACALDRLEGSGVTQTFAADTNWTPAGAAEAASALIATGDPVDAILYDYADPLPGVVDTYLQAGEVPPGLVTWTMNNDLFRVWEEAQGTDNAFALYYTNGLNWVARVALTAAINAYDGNPSDAVINYPLPFVEAVEGKYQPDRPGDYPGSAIVPAELVDRMIG